MTSLTDPQLLRYSRHILLPQIDLKGQQQLLASSVLVVGAGGLGGPVAMYLAAAGVGHIYLADADQIDLSNLQRQIQFGQADIGRYKVNATLDTVAGINAEVQLHPLICHLEGQDLDERVAAVDLVLDCTDNFTSRFAINASCRKFNKPLVSGAAIGFDGQVAVFMAGANSPCYQCLYPQQDEEGLTCSQAGVVAPLVGIIGSIQALEAIKLLTGAGQCLDGRLLVLDGLTMQTRVLQLKRDPACACCGSATLGAKSC